MRLTDPLATPLPSQSVIDDEEEAHRHESEDHTHVSEEHSRCTRCIATKKGCDRKRPCSRCVQQGFEEWECKSDDEKGSARKKVAAMRRSTLIGKTVIRSRRANR